MISRLCYYIYPLIIVGAMLCTPIYALPNFLKGQEIENHFLPIEKAFSLEASFQDSSIVLRWHIADAYYLYADQFRLEPTSLQYKLIGQPVSIDDPAFGKQNVYKKHLDIVVAPKEMAKWHLVIHYQGCAESGYCYPPSQYRFQVDPQQQNIIPASPSKKG